MSFSEIISGHFHRWREDEISSSAPMLGSRPFGRWPMTSGLPLETDIVRAQSWLLNRQVGRLFTLEYSAGATNRHMIETLKAWGLVRAWVSVK